MRREIVCYKITDNVNKVHYVPLTMDVRDCLEKYCDFKIIERKKIIAKFTSSMIYGSSEYKLKNGRGLQKLNLKVAEYYYIDCGGKKIVINKYGFPETKKEKNELLQKIQAEHNYVIKYTVEDFPCYVSKEVLLKLSDIEEVG